MAFDPPGKRIQFGEISGRQRQQRALDVFVDPLWLPRAGDRDNCEIVNGRLALQPRQGLRSCGTVAQRDLANDRDQPRIDVFDKAAVAATDIVGVEARGIYAAGELAATERRVRHKADAEFCGGRHHRLFRLARVAL